MRSSIARFTTLIAIGALFGVSSCEHFKSESPSHETTPRKSYSRAASKPAEKPEVVTPESHRTCVDTFKLAVGTPRYEKCVNSLGELERGK